MVLGAVARKGVRVTGVVQGVGFRPFVVRLAGELELTGLVGNDVAGVFIEVQGSADRLASFLGRLRDDAPALAVVERVVVSDLEPIELIDAGDAGVAGVAGVPEPAFRIVGSEHAGGVSTLIPPDVATCDECMAEVLDPGDRRHRYPFTNCTNCGPRFTIIRSLPYDRPATSMAGFAMCGPCAAEYEDPGDRRFHAQPIACPDCGPQLSFLRAGRRETGTDPVLTAVHAALAAGEIVAIKGLGGYHLTCDARNDEAVGRLRRRKGRSDKPLALLVPDLEAAAAAGRARPRRAGSPDLAGAAHRPVPPSRRRARFGARGTRQPAGRAHAARTPRSTTSSSSRCPARSVRRPPPSCCTSGNLSDERICFEDDDALTRLGSLADAFCTNDRPIEVPCDDSVVRVVDGGVVPVRRSRGYAPLPIRLPVDVTPTIGLGRRAQGDLLPGGRRPRLGEPAHRRPRGATRPSRPCWPRLLPSARCTASSPSATPSTGIRATAVTGSPSTAPGPVGPRCSTTTRTSPRSWPSTGSTARHR